MKTFTLVCILMVLIAAFAPLAPATQARQSDEMEVVVTVRSVEVPGGCLITVEGATGTFAGFTGLVMDEVRPSQFFELAFGDHDVFYTVDWGLIQVGFTTIFVYCRKTEVNNDFLAYVHGGSISNAQGMLDGLNTKLDSFWNPSNVSAPTPPEFQIDELVGWDYAGSNAWGHKAIKLIINPISPNQ